MTHLVTASHPITLEGGRSVEPGEKVNVKSSDPHVQGLIENGQLIELPKKKTVSKPSEKAATPEKEEAK